MGANDTVTSLFSPLQDRAVHIWALPQSVWCFLRYEIGSTRALRSSKPALPNMVRFIIFNRRICPSTGLVVHDVTREARMAAASRSRAGTRRESRVSLRAFSKSLRLSSDFLQSRFCIFLTQLVVFSSWGSAARSSLTNRVC